MRANKVVTERIWLARVGKTWNRKGAERPISYMGMKQAAEVQNNATGFATKSQHAVGSKPGEASRRKI